MPDALDDAALLRYSRHILLPEIGIEGQSRLRAAGALIVGLGGLGSPAAMYLAAAGVGRLALADDDAVALSDLQRQIMHRTDRVGEPKTRSAVRSLRALNPDVETHAVARRLDEDSLAEPVAAADIVLDASDNFATRYAVNRVCRRLRVPLVSGAVIRLEGQVGVFSGRDDDPCYACVYPERLAGPIAAGADDERCVANGVLGPVAGIVGCVMATEAIKWLLALGESLHRRLLLLDAARMRWRELRVRPDAACAVCGGGARTA